ncbi:hypothetical protein SCALM49S_08644 [Streptomyces californicus]
MRWAPNHTTATDDTLTTVITVGNISAISRPVATDTSVSSVFAPRNRFSSYPSRTKARMTRLPVICSRSTRFTPSSRSCMVRNSGRILFTIRPTETPSTGTTASSTAESGTSCPSAMMMPPTHMIGADTIRVNASSTSIWICWTSLVVRVISEGAPNRPSSRAEKDCTRSKTAARTSRPSAEAVRAP